MDDFDIEDFGKKTPDEDEGDIPIPFDDIDDTDVSHTPLNLGDTPAPAPAKPKKHLDQPIKIKSGGKIVSTDRITGVKTFFTKLHAGAIDFINDQVND